MTRAPSTDGTRRCSRCGQSKPADEFRPNVRMRDGLSSWCKPCNVERNRLWRAEHREEYRAAARRRYVPRAPRFQFTCRVCGVTGPTQQPRKLYCSPACAQQRGMLVVG